uniref:Replication factor A C-terminal domain-containing protein n=1 Tax=Arundo donax TaxID=35708 RepID=A0A0A9B3B4_ARUDO
MQNEIKDKTLLQLKEVYLFKQMDHRFRCTVTITKVVLDQGWYYPACKSYKTRVRFDGLTYKCPSYGCLTSEDRYKIPLMENDDTYELEFILFGETAQQLIGRPVTRLQALYDKHDIPTEISSLVGQKYTFIVKISSRKSAQNEDPSFEVLKIICQMGKQICMPTFRKKQLATSSELSVLSSKSPTSSTSKNLAPLIPIKSKQGFKEEKEITEIELMDIDQTQLDIDNKLSLGKRPHQSTTHMETILHQSDNDDTKTREHMRNTNKRTRQ